MDRLRIVAHVDMDAFYAAVEERLRPELRGRPLVVGADPRGGAGRGVVTTANYLARRYGIRSAMPIARAWRLAETARRRGEPATVFVRGQPARYAEVSARLMAMLAERADAFEEASIDEAYLDLSSLGSFERAAEHARALKREVGEREGLTCSVGIGPNKLVAKIASDADKPDGLTVVPLGAVQAFLDPRPVRVIPGVGPKTELRLSARGIRTVRDLRAVPLLQLVDWFGRWGEDLHDRARGLDPRPVSNVWEPKSVGAQETFETDSRDPAFLVARARALAREVASRLVAQGFSAFRTVVLTVRFEDFATVTRAWTAPAPRSGEEALFQAALRLLLPFLDHRENPQRRRLRLIGVRAERLLR